MGRYPWSDRRTVEQCRSLGVSDLARAGVFKKGPAYSWTCRWTNATGEEAASLGYQLTSGSARQLALRLAYTITDRFTGEKSPLDYPVEITTTGCHFGGRRYWFRCPLVINGVPCRRRVGKLYLPSGRRYFGCRICYDLTYRSAQEHDKRVDALRRLPLDELLRAGKCENRTSSLLALKASLRKFRGRRRYPFLGSQTAGPESGYSK